MKVLWIISVLFLIIFQGECVFPSTPTKASMFDSSNIFIDQMNQYLFTLYGILQDRFDKSLALVWLYWRSASLVANTRGFVVASENRTVLSACIGSFDDAVNKLIAHLTNDAMKPLFDLRETDTKIEADLAKDFNEVKDLIFRANNEACLKKLYYNEYAIGLKYYKYRNFLARQFADITYKTEADYNARFYLEHLTTLNTLIQVRSSIMLARTRSDYNNFVKTYCKPEIFAKFDNLIDISNNIVNDCAKRIYNTLNEALAELPEQSPFKNQIAACL